MTFQILVVEDEPPILELLKYNLEKEGYNVLTSDNGNDALEIVEYSLPQSIKIRLIGFLKFRPRKFHRNVGRLFLGCIDASDSESWRIFSIFRDLQDMHSFAPLQTQKFSKMSLINFL